MPMHSVVYHEKRDLGPNFVGNNPRKGNKKRWIRFHPWGAFVNRATPDSSFPLSHKLKVEYAAALSFLGYEP